MSVDQNIQYNKICQLSANLGTGVTQFVPRSNPFKRRYKLNYPKVNAEKQKNKSSYNNFKRIK